MSHLRRAAVFPKVDSPFGAEGLWGRRADTLGPKGSIRDRLAPPGWVQGLRPRELYSTTALARYGAYGASIHAACRRRKPHCREAAYKMAPAGRFPLASAAMLYNSRGRKPSTRL